MGCCGVGATDDLPPVGEKQPGDVLGRAMWGGNRRERGTVTGRLYERVGNGATTWVDPRDIQARPLLWQEVVEIDTPVDMPPVFDGLDAIARVLVPGQVWSPPVPPVQPVAVQPNVSGLISMARERIA